jgi:hypothetical protein
VTQKTPSPAEIEAARTPAGGWSKETLAGWGVSWPPPKGWKKALEARYASQPRHEHRWSTDLIHTNIIQGSTTWEGGVPTHTFLMSRRCLDCGMSQLYHSIRDHLISKRPMSFRVIGAIADMAHGKMALTNHSALGQELVERLAEAGYTVARTRR